MNRFEAKAVAFMENILENGSSIREIIRAISKAELILTQSNLQK